MQIELLNGFKKSESHQVVIKIEKQLFLRHEVAAVKDIPVGKNLETLLLTCSKLEKKILESY